MNLIALTTLTVLYWTGSVRSLALFKQKENLFIDNLTPRIPLTPYFTNYPKTFGLVADKSRSYVRDGYICAAQNIGEFVDGCQ